MYSESLPVLLDHLEFLDKNITRPLKEYNDCQVQEKVHWLIDWLLVVHKELNNLQVHFEMNG